MDGAHALLVALLVLDGIQAAVAAVAVTHGHVRRGRGEHELALYSFRHAGLLLVGALVLAVPLLLGLTGALSARVALWVVLAAEAAGLVAARAILGRFHAAAHRG